MKQRRLFSLLLVVLMFVMSFSGCAKEETYENSNGSKENTSGGTDNEVSKTINQDEITLVFSIWGKVQEASMVALGEAFTEKYPNIKIDVQVTPWGEYWTKLEAGAIGKSMPDVFWMHTNEINKYVKNDLLMKVNDSMVDFSKFPEHVTNLYTYEGEKYGVPKDFDTIALFYNKEIFDAAGEPYPDNSWDWDKLLEVAKKLNNEEEGIFGFLAPYEPQAGFYPFVYQNGGTILTEDKTSGFALPETQEAVKFYFDMINEHGVSPNLDYFAENGNDTAFSSGKAAMMINGSWRILPYAENEMIAGKFDVEVLPLGKERATMSNGLAFSGSNISDHPEAVKEFLTFLASEEAHIIMGKTSPAIPAYQGTQQYWNERLEGYNADVFTEMLEYAVPVPTSQSKQKWLELLKLTLSSYIQGDINEEEAFTYITEEMNEILETEK